MELEYFGANCLRLTIKKATIVFDDNLQSLGLKPVLKVNDIGLFSDKRFTEGLSGVGSHIIDGPGEYEIAEVMIRGIAVPSHLEEQKNITMYSIHAEGFSIAYVGHCIENLSEQQLESLGTVDLLIVPVGGGGYTLDAVGAKKLIKKIEPNAVILTHYADTAVKYEVPQDNLENIIKELAVEVIRVSSLKIKDFEPDALQLYYALERK